MLGKVTLSQSQVVTTAVSVRRGIVQASYGRFEAQATDQTVLERFCFLDDAHLDLAANGAVITTRSGSLLGSGLAVAMARLPHEGNMKRQTPKEGKLTACRPLCSSP